MDDIKEIVLGVMADILGMSTSEIPEDAAPGVLEEWDSLRHLTLTIALEEEFDIRFSDEEMAEMLNLPLIVDILSEKCGAGK